MSVELASLAERLCALLVTYALHSSVLLLAVWFLHRFVRSFRESPFLVERTWKAAAILGLCTAPAVHFANVVSPAYVLEMPAPRSGADVSSDARAERRVVASTAASTAGNDALPVDPAPFARPARDSTAAPGATTPFAGARAAALPAAMLDARGQRGAAPRWPALLAGAFALFVVLGLARLLLQTRRFERRLRGCRELTWGPARELVDGLVARSGVRRPVTLLIAPDLAEPAAFGLLRQRILLPRGIERELPRRELYALLAHELAHLARGDAWWLLIGRLLCTPLAFQPLNFIARRRWQRAAELGCDEWATHHGADRLALARCLALVAEWRLERSCPDSGLAAAAARSPLAERIERLVGAGSHADPWRARGRRRVLALLLVATASAAGVLGPRLELRAGAEPRGRLSSDRTPAEAPATGLAAARESAPAPFAAPAPWSAFERTPAEHGAAGELAALDRELDLLVEEARLLAEQMARSPSLAGSRPPADLLAARIESLQRKRRLLAQVLVGAGREDTARSFDPSPSGTQSEDTGDSP